MNAATYEHPLYSFELVSTDAAGEAEGRYAIAVPQGRLVVTRALRLNGRRITAAACDQAVSAGLAVHGLAADAFAAYGLGREWAQSMSYWQAQLRAREEALARLEGERKLRTERLSSLWQQGLLQHRRLATCAALCGKGKMIVSSPAPRARAALRDALSSARQRAAEYADPLSRHGFGPQELAGLDALLSSMKREEEDATAAEWRRSDLSGESIALRAALLGDLGRLVKVAPLVLDRKAAAAVRLGRLVRGTIAAA